VNVNTANNANVFRNMLICNADVCLDVNVKVSSLSYEYCRSEDDCVQPIGTCRETLSDCSVNKVLC
jgi:hypothetical protein